MKIKPFLLLSTIVLLVIVLIPAHPGGRAAEHTYWVNSAEDIGDNTLRWAINQANTHVGSGDILTIEFDMLETDPNFNDSTGVWTITVDSALPALIASNTIIDGYSQEGAEYGTSSRSPMLLIEINGENLVVDPPLYGNSGFNILSSGNTITGLMINNFPVNGISIAGTSAANNTIAGNCIGTDYQCAHPVANGGDGVFIGLGAKNNLVGGILLRGKISFYTMDWMGLGSTAAVPMAILSAGI